MSKQITKIAIVGVGLIGGSIGLALKKKKIAQEVVGLCRRKSSLIKALKYKTVDRATLNIEDAVKGAEIVFIATPVNKIANIVGQIAKKADKKTVITDVGSVKSLLINKINKTLSRNIFFIGGHPMAGSEKSGTEKAQADLFVNSVCILVKDKNTNEAALSMIKKIWQEIGSDVKVLSSKEHDAFISQISHFPHLLAYTLTNMARPEALQYAATGFRDTTRIASSDPKLWASIMLLNKKNIRDNVNTFIKKLRHIQKLIAKNKEKEIIRIFTESKNKRDKVF